MADIAKNIARIKSEIGSSIRLVAITKGRSLAEINEAISAGITEIGENKVQEAAEKFGRLQKTTGITKHMVGHLQSNKVKDAVALFDVIQSVDSIKLAGKIAEEATLQKKRISIYLQVNVSGKDTQSGFATGEIEAAANEIRKFRHEFFVVGGLMVIASQDNPRGDFRKAKEICGRLGLKIFSAGMSGDYEIAVEKGSNMVRIGTAIFGEGEKNQMEILEKKASENASVFQNSGAFG